MRILITGGPGTGKTHLARVLGPGPSPHCTDAAMHLGWSEASEEVARWFDRDGDWIVEGVAVPRALRKWAFMNGCLQLPGVPKLRPGNRPPPPCDKLIILRHRHPAGGPETPGQAAMAKGLHTVLSEVLEGWPELRRVTEWR